MAAGTETEEELLVRTTIEQLQGSSRGDSALVGLASWMDAHAFGLDERNQAAIAILLAAVWGPRSGTAWSMIRNAVGADM